MIAGLPEITFANKDESMVKSEVIAGYEAAAGRTLALGDPIRIFLESIAAIIVQQRALIDFTGKMNLLAYAVDDYLDHLGSFLGVTRLPAAASLTTLRFTLSSAQIGATLIPLGTRATADGQTLFATTVAATIPAGQLYVDVPAVCQTPGASGNNIIIGAIINMVDTIPYVYGVTNTTVSAGGSDIEDDESYRERIHQAPEKFTNAGSRGAYEFWAKSANSSIIDVSVISPSAGVVNVYPLMIGGTIPTSDVLDEVNAIVNAENIRPLTDEVHVLAPTTMSYTINVTYYILTSNSAIASTIQSAVSAAVDDFILWQKSALGRDVEPSELISKMVMAGAKRVTITSPSFSAVSDAQVAVCSSSTVTFGGFEN